MWVHQKRSQKDRHQNKPQCQWMSPDRLRVPLSTEQRLKQRNNQRAAMLPKEKGVGE